MDQIFSSPEFWQKLAASDRGTALITVEDQEQMLHSALSYFKEAGYSPFVVIGYLQTMASFNDDFSKVADGADWSWFNPEQEAWMGEALHPWRDGSAADRVKARLLDSSKAGLPMPTNIGEQFPNVAKTIQTQHPTAHSLLSGLYNNDPERANQTMLRLGRGEYGEAAGQVWDGLQSNSTVKKLAPYVIPGMAGVAAGRMAGLGWGGSLAAGGAMALGGNAINNQVQQAGGWQHLYHKWMKPKAPVAPAPSPAPAAAPAASTAAPAGAPSANQNMQANSANAANIQQSTSPTGAPKIPGPLIPGAQNAQVNQGAQPAAPTPAVPPLPQLPKVGFQKNFNLDVGGLSPTQLGGLIGAAPGIVGGGALGALIPSTDENGETHRMRNALIGAGIGGATTGLGGAAVGHVGERVVKELAPVVNPSLWDILGAKHSPLQRGMGRSSLLETTQDAMDKLVRPK